MSDAVTKTCSKCGLEKPIDKFYRDGRSKNGRQSQCMVCALIICKRYRESVTGKANYKRWYKSEKGTAIRKQWEQSKEGKVNRKRHSRKKNLKKYDLNPEDYDRMLAEQKGCCVVCGRHQSELKRNLAVHHDHRTKKVICLLCSKCNTGLGCFNHSSKLMEKAVAFVRRYQDNS